MTCVEVCNRYTENPTLMLCAHTEVHCESNKQQQIFVCDNFGNCGVIFFKLQLHIEFALC